MNKDIFSSTPKPCRTAGFAALASGIIGMAAVAFLIAFLTGHLRDKSDFSLVRVHDAGVIIQFLFLIIVAVNMKRLPRQSAGIGRNTLTFSIVTLSATVVFLLLNFPHIIADVLYMFPQGLFGVSLMVICWSRKGIIPAGLRWSGLIVGFGLALVGLYPVGYPIFVDSVLLQIPAPSEEVLARVPMNKANINLHLMIMVGSILGVLPLPFWTLVLSGWFLKNFSKERSTAALPTH